MIWCSNVAICAVFYLLQKPPVSTKVEKSNFSNSFEATVVGGPKKNGSYIHLLET